MLTEGWFISWLRTPRAFDADHGALPSRFGSFFGFIFMIRLLFASICMYNPARFNSI
jgi:hypothetical protein